MDTSKARLTDGHYAVASITGAPVSLVIAAFQLARHHSLTKAHGMPEVKDTSLAELKSALSLLGFQGEWEAVPQRPTVRRFAWDLADNKHIGYAWLLKLTDEVIAVTEGNICGAHTAGKVLYSETAPGRNKKVRMALRVQKFTGASVLLASSWRSSLKQTAYT